MHPGSNGLNTSSDFDIQVGNQPALGNPHTDWSLRFPTLRRMKSRNHIIISANNLEYLHHSATSTSASTFECECEFEHEPTDRHRFGVSGFIFSQIPFGPANESTVTSVKLCLFCLPGYISPLASLPHHTFPLVIQEQFPLAMTGKNPDFQEKREETISAPPNSQNRLIHFIYSGTVTQTH